MLKPHPIAALLMPVAFLFGCENTTHPKLAGGGMDMFTPVKMRLHPLSRLVPALPPPSPAAAEVEARIEFTDQFGDIGKGVGSVNFELHAYETLAIDHKGRLLDHWSSDISTPQQNQNAWDGITRTYLFHHPLAANLLARRNQVVLVAVVTLPNGSKLGDAITLSVK